MVYKKSQQESIFWSFIDSPKFHWLLVFRLLNLWLVKTWFVPDEYFQSVEVAYQRVFHIGHLSWEWDTKSALRSFIHPLLFIFVYCPLKWLHLDSNFLIRLAPHLIHVLLFAIADFYMIKLIQRLFDGKDKQAIRYSFLLYLSNWFVFFCAPRTLSNSLETVLTIIGLHFYPLEPIRLIVKRNNPYPFGGYVICAALACLIRPTSALIWVPLGLWHLYKSNAPFTVLFKHLLPPALFILFSTAILDIIMYKRLTLPAWNFIQFNVLSSGSANFGVHPFHWYLTEGIPPVFTVATFPLAGAFLERFGYLIMRHKLARNLRYQPNTHLLFYVAIFYIVFHSFIAHKEHRFILPIIPLVVSHISSYLCRSKHGKFLFWAIVVVQIPVSYYFSAHHQKAPGELIDYLNKELPSKVSHSAPTQSDVVLVSQLLPCYSMPQYAAIHPFGLQNVEFLMLDCTPLFGKNSTLPGNSQDESDLFHYDPLNFVRTRWEKIGHSSFIIVYERTFKQMETFLRSHGFTIAERFYNTRFPVSERQDQWVLVLTRQSQEH